MGAVVFIYQHPQGFCRSKYVGLKDIAVVVEVIRTQGRGTDWLRTWFGHRDS